MRRRAEHHVELLAIYRIEPSDKEIHLNNERSELFKLSDSRHCATSVAMTSPPQHFLSEPTDSRSARLWYKLYKGSRTYFRCRTAR
jgi:hypothetical protein